MYMIPNFIEIGQTFCGRTDRRTDVPTDGRTFPPLMLLGRLRGADLKIRGGKEERVSEVLRLHGAV